MRIVRRNYFPNPRLQWQLIFAANGLALISAVLIALLMFLAQLHLESCASLLPLASGQGTLRATIAEQETSLLRSCVLIAITQFVLFNLVAVVLSHRIAGPLYRLQKHMREVAAGSAPNDVKFREGDLFQELAVACNELLARLRGVSARS
jgi:methyl-accepting chemotaxis protein